MKIVKTLLTGIFGLFLACLVLVILAFAIAFFSDTGRIAFPVAHSPRQFQPGDDYPSALTRSGNRLVDEEGQIIILKGLMPPDPLRLHARNLFSHKFFLQIAQTGANAVRIPVHPESWRKDPDYLWRYLEPIAHWAGEAGMYLIIDWHYIGNIADGSGKQMPDIPEHPLAYSKDFWTAAASHFSTAPHVLFEIFNEPADISSSDWFEAAAELLALIRSQNADQVVIVGGINYSRDLSWVNDFALDDDNIAFAAHIYPAHTKALWDHWFGSVSEEYPVIHTEWGFMEKGSGNQAYLFGTEDGYGQPLLDYAEKHDIGWIACWYDDRWEPPMFRKGFRTPTPFGDFVFRELARK